jgi:general secretion pathway protein G
VIVATIMGVLAGMAVPNYNRVLERARITRAIGDIRAIGQNLAEYYETNGTYPSSLADLGAVPIDPWGNPYEYLPVEGASRGDLRKDRFLVPVNSDFDLYSMGPDGASAAPFTAADSRDDIVRANDGGYVGIADNY